MAVSSFSCSLNQLPPPTQSSGPSSSPKTNQVLAWNKSDGGSWSSRCVVGMTCVMVGLEMSGLGSGQSHEAIAKGMPLVMESGEKVAKWSEKRICPKWRANELETIVPENLPRPSAHRRWEIVGFNTKDAPAVKIMIARRSSGGCFSM
ncbi:protein CHLOROPLAST VESICULATION [Argentina anserina]|uniref:protein CHLOROPLAST VESICULATION n=1 Tax=Argentina anserina TaxID=57926 RepID=UPI00217638BD|nr:protein CHLOROPLAST VESICULATION [Potentilla anserina]